MNEQLDYRRHVRADTDRMAALAAGAGGMAVRVPACPDWDVAALLAHVGRTHRVAAGAILDQRPPVPGAHNDEPEDRREFLGWFASGASRVLDALDRDPAEPAWSFDPEGQNVGFWRRRQAMENLVHRVDAEQAWGVRTPVDPDLASDGVGEVVEVVMRLRRDAGALQLPAGAVELCALDTGHTWIVGDESRPLQVGATAEQLLLVLWKRLSPEMVTDDPVALGLLRAQLTP